MKYCPRCLRTEADIPACPDNDFAGMSCPEPVEENPEKDVAIKCGPCDFSRIVPVRELLSGAAKNKLPSCRRDECACVVVPAPMAATDPVMPEIAAFAEAAAEAAPPVAPAPEAPVEDTPSIDPDQAEADAAETGDPVVEDTPAPKKATKAKK